MATHFSFWAAPFILAPGLLLGLTAGGCVHIGQSGGEPGCAEPHHCLCEANYAYRMRGMVVRADGANVEVMVLELPDGESIYPDVKVGTVIGGENYACETPLEHAPGDEVWVFNYQPGTQDLHECPDMIACMRSVDDWEQCLELEREACSVYRDDALRGGYLILARESDGFYDLGDDATGPAVIAVDEANAMPDVATCDAQFPPPPLVECNDTGGGFFSWAW